jgi:hypothetical protein
MQLHKTLRGKQASPRLAPLPNPERKREKLISVFNRIFISIRKERALSLFMCFTLFLFLFLFSQHSLLTSLINVASIIKRNGCNRKNAPSFFALASFFF